MPKNKRDLSNTDFVTDGYTTEELNQKILEIRDKYEIEKLTEPASNELKEKIKNEYKFFEERYPFLFEMIIKRDFDKERLDYFLSMREKIINNNITQEKASIKIGQEMYDTYMKK